MLQYKIIDYDGDRYADLPEITNATLIDGDFMVVPWLEHYTWSWLADTVLGDQSLSTYLMYINNVFNPFQDMTNKTIKVPINV